MGKKPAPPILVYTSAVGEFHKSSNIQFRPRKYKFDVRMGSRSVAHRADFKTKKDPDDWQTVKIPFESLEPTWRGRRLPKLLNRLKDSEIVSLGFMIYDKKDGPFNLKVDWIKAY